MSKLSAAFSAAVSTNLRDNFSVVLPTKTGSSLTAGSNFDDFQQKWSFLMKIQKSRLTGNKNLTLKTHFVFKWQRSCLMFRPTQATVTSFVKTRFSDWKLLISANFRLSEKISLISIINWKQKKNQTRRLCCLQSSEALLRVTRITISPKPVYKFPTFHVFLAETRRQKLSGNLFLVQMLPILP